MHDRISSISKQLVTCNFNWKRDIKSVSFKFCFDKQNPLKKYFSNRHFKVIIAIVIECSCKDFLNLLLNNFRNYAAVRCLEISGQSYKALYNRNLLL